MQNSIHNTLFNGCQYEKYLQMTIFFATRSQNMQIFILQGVSIFQHPVVNMRKMPIFDTHTRKHPSIGKPFHFWPAKWSFIKVLLLLPHKTFNGFNFRMTDLKYWLAIFFSNKTFGPKSSSLLSSPFTSLQSLPLLGNEVGMFYTGCVAKKKLLN